MITKEQFKQISDILEGRNKNWCAEWECYVYCEEDVRDIILTLLKNKEVKK